VKARFLVGGLAGFGVVFGFAALIFMWGANAMSFWPSVVVGGVACGVIGAMVVGAAWKHVEAQAKKDPTQTTSGGQGMTQPPSSPGKPDKPSPPTGSPTINSPGGINIFGGTVNNPTIHNYATPRPWALDAQQSDLLARRLAPYAPGRTDKHDLIAAVMGDPDSAKFAWSLVSAFRAAKWSGVGGSGYAQSIFQGNVEGIIVQVHSREATPRGLEEFARTLQEAGFQVIGAIVPDVPTDEFRIIVGHRPQ
jgi:hypothetical protein